MWLWLWAVLIFTTSHNPLAAEAKAPPIPPTSVGPTSAEEAEVLWREGRNSFDAGEYRDAVSDLQRLIDRYPGFAGFREAHLLVGRARLKLGEPARAIAPIQFYIQGAAEDPDVFRAKLSLARAYVGTRQFHEAELLCEELERKFEHAMVTSPDLRGENLLLKAQALIGVNHDDRARMSLDSAKGYLASPRISPSLRAEGAWMEIIIHNRRCALLPDHGQMEE
ncbi:MAG: tetratricopeptide repeat protein, partial [Bdellovibrionota bacterium]